MIPKPLQMLAWVSLSKGTILKETLCNYMYGYLFLCNTPIFETFSN